MILIQDRTNKVILPHVPSQYSTGVYNIVFECKEEVSYPVLGNRCQCSLILEVEHDCEDTTKINFDIGIYEIRVYHVASGDLVFVGKLKIFIP